jgi:hypothetical protein
VTSRAGTTAGTVRERRRPYKLGSLSPQITLGLHAQEATSLERELFSQTWRKSAVGDSAEAQIVSRRRVLGAYLSDGRITWAPNFLISAVIFIRHGDFNVRLSSSVYYVAHRFYNSAYIFEIRLDFGNPPIFWKSAYILEIRLYFGYPPDFS